MKQKTFSAATFRATENQAASRVLAKSLSFLVTNMNADGTWGTLGALDRLITTTHVVMALQIFGVPTESSLLSRAFRFMETIDTDKQVSFFYRAAPLLNIPQYDKVIRHDLKFMWEFRRRVAVHKDYPNPFFLLKMLEFQDRKLALSISKKDVLDWILEDWDDDTCWYGRTSITSMALPLIYDAQFPRKSIIVKRCSAFLKENFGQQERKRPGWTQNLVDDAFTVFNLCDRKFLNRIRDPELYGQVFAVARDLERRIARDGKIVSEPPFGGDVGDTVYPTAVCIRAVASFRSLDDDEFSPSVCGALVGDIQALGHNHSATAVRHSIWGPLDLPTKPATCFVLMPFEEALTDIYREHIKKPIETQLHNRGKTKYRVFRADDIFRPTQIMEDIWKSICTAEFIIADLTGKNPNVFYEAGLSHAIGKRPILIAQNRNDIPFDLQGVRTIIYSTTPSGYKKLSEQLLAFLGAPSET